MAERTGQAMRLHMAEVELKDVVSFAEGLPGGSRLVSLSWERLACAGMLVLAPGLCRAIVAHALNLPLADAAGTPPTALEESVLRGAAGGLARIFMAEYERAGLPGLRIGNWSGVQAISEALPAFRELVSFQFRTEQASASASASIIRMALDSEFLLRLAESDGQETSFRGKKLTDGDVLGVPVCAQVSLHRFRIPVRELANLRPGSRLCLPDPDEAWLLGPSGERLLRLAVQIDQGSGKARCTIKPHPEESL
ncbi:MAG: hypothetical protein ACREP6_11615 [Candidatus Binataceae bacterium]